MSSTTLAHSDSLMSQCFGRFSMCVCVFHNLIVAINLEFCSCISLVNFHFYSGLNVQAQHLVGICATVCVCVCIGVEYPNMKSCGRKSPPKAIEFS